MSSENKFYETGSNPYYLNLNNTALEYSSTDDSTNPEYGFLKFMNEHILVEDPIILNKNSLHKDEE